MSHNESITAIALGNQFALVPSEKAEGLNLRLAGAVCVNNNKHFLFKTWETERNIKLEALLEQYGKYPIEEYKLQPVIMSGKLEITFPDFDLRKDKLYFDSFSFHVDGKDIPVDFCGRNLTILASKIDTALLSFRTGDDIFVNNYFADDEFLDDRFYEDYKKSGLDVKDITSEFLSKTDEIKEFSITLTVNGKEYHNDDIAKNGELNLLELSFADGVAWKYYVNNEVLSAFNESLKNQKTIKPGLDEQILSAKERIDCSGVMENDEKLLWKVTFFQITPDSIKHEFDVYIDIDSKETKDKDEKFLLGADDEKIAYAKAQKFIGEDVISDYVIMNAQIVSSAQVKEMKLREIKAPQMER